MTTSPRPETSAPAYLTTAQLAARLGLTPQRVLQLAADRGVAPAMLAGRAKLWRESDLARLERRAPGRPRLRSPPGSPPR